MNDQLPPLLPWAPELATPTGAPPAAAPRRAPGFAAATLLALRLAWRQLRSEKARFASAIAGVMFACVLVFMQLGFRAALFDSATALIGAMRGDLFLIHPLTTASFKPEPLPRGRAYQVLALPEVERAVPVYLAQATWRNPENGTRRAIQLIGVDTDAGVLDFPGLAPLVEQLKRADTVAFDSRSRPEFGAVPRLLAERGPFAVEVGNRQVDVVGLIEIGPSFGADGNLVLSDVNFRRVVKERQVAAIDLVAIKLRPDSDVLAVQRQLRDILPADAMVMTQAELNAHERKYWEEATPIGFIFAFGSLMGLVVGMVIVYQILFSDIAGHLKEYATLKAMGYSNFYLGRVVLGASLILAIGGFIPGFLLSAFLYDVVGAATFLPLAMDVSRATSVFLMIFTMCAVAGLLAMRKLRDANPADMF
ncbi:ABC transporter permease DevC [Falsiroseomonas stagni]|uniref:Putative ABC transport system permease protein n=1 Tax=Falsiroseomonas stagni DSM 19981 TaxID=1123062 RepID=A0A1I4CVB4_9PROT|nr:ABC transporter permease DevC [Falsiroseomonas stagni]SFK84269.1 putative ABC transport system permease protein [Falsiroseomonas stagni DSM 19981]